MLVVYLEGVVGALMVISSAPIAGLKRTRGGVPRHKHQGPWCAGQAVDELQTIQNPIH